MTLPIPDSFSLLHSKKLITHIRETIEKSGGFISFAKFMQLALYSPGLGYYSAGSHKLGKKGDFITAPEISPLFGACIARQCQQIFSELAPHERNLFEVGAGSGILARDLLVALEKINCLPQHYYILEISAELRARQRAYLTLHCPAFLSRIIWLDTLPDNFSGIILANELLDAMPIHCFRIEKNGIKERSVTWQDQQFSWCLTDPSTELKSRLQILREEVRLATDYESEINLQLPAWIATFANLLQKGMILLFDYGYGRAEYYHPDRCRGTLMCFYQHHKHDDPFLLVGLQDITAHVDFTSVIASACAAGLSLAGYTTQAAFLLACGLLEFANQIPLDVIERTNQHHAIKLLTLPSQMGELIKVMALSKNLDLSLLGFEWGDRRRDL